MGENCSTKNFRQAFFTHLRFSNDKHCSSSSSIQFLSGFIPINRGGCIYPTLMANSPTPTLHLARFIAFFFSKPSLLLSFSTCVFHVFFGCPRFLLPFNSNSNAFLKTCPSSLLNKCLCHLTPFAFAICNGTQVPYINLDNSLRH